MSQPPQGYAPPQGYGPPQGHGPPQGYGPPQGFAPPPKKSNTVVIVIIVLAIVGFCVIVLGTLGIHGVRRYLQTAKTSEAKNTLGAIARGAVAAYERDKKLCPSATEAVPKAPPNGKKHQSSALDWERDASANAGFACLKFTFTNPQYYSYSYTATESGFVATARGDLDGDGKFSTFTLEGKVQNGSLKIAEEIKLVDEFE